MTGDIAKVLHDIDKTIQWYLKSNKIIEQECGYFNGKLQDSRKFNEYEMRRTSVRKNYEEKSVALMKEFNKLADDLNKKNMDFDRRLKNLSRFICRQFICGELRIKYANLDRKIPLPIDIPVSKSLCAEVKDKDYILQFMLEMLFSFPPGLCQFYIYDPNHFGSSVECFDVLRNFEEIFPDKKFLFNEKDLKQLLDELGENFANMRQKLFPAQNCRSWLEYNQKMQLKNKSSKQIPYKVLVCFDLPELCTAEILATLKRLANEGANFGFLLLFTFNQKIFLEEKKPFDGSVFAYQNDRSIIALKALCEDTADLKCAFTALNEVENLKCLKVEENVSEKISIHMFEKYLRSYKELLESQRGQIIDFYELTDSENLFNSNAIKGLEIPLGSSVENGEILKLSIGDQPPHALIAGATGSGKSNLLHVLIVNACCRYSPAELNLYLVDFKDGVEFNTYTRPILPHLKLVATQADSEYVQTVLTHLTQEISSRNNLFKNYRCKDYSDFRQKNPAEILPRIVLIVDEFQRIFDTNANAVADLLEILTKQGRSVGVHLIFATQTFKGVGNNTAVTLNFTQLKGQFGARIALKCSPEDSKDILGQNNEAAVDLKIPYAILNSDGGGVKYNKKFAVPESKPEQVAETLKKIVAFAGEKAVDTHIFEGQTLPIIPAVSEFCRSDCTFLLGQNLTYDADNFEVNLKIAPEENILFCTQEDIFKKCVLNFVQSSKLFDEIVYIGKKFFENFSNFKEPQEFFTAIKESKFNLRRLIILDECKFPKISYAPKPDEIEFANYWQEVSENNSHIIAFYSTFSRLKDSNLEYTKLFKHRIACHLPQSQTFQLGGIQSVTGQIDDRFKAAYFYQEKIKWFRPFAE